MCSDDQGDDLLLGTLLFFTILYFLPSLLLALWAIRNNSFLFTLHRSPLRLASFHSGSGAGTPISFLNLSSHPSSLFNLLARTCIPDSILSPLFLLLSWSFSVRHPQHQHPPGPPLRPTFIVRRMETHPRSHLPRKRCRLLRRAWHFRLLKTL